MPKRVGKENIAARLLVTTLAGCVLVSGQVLRRRQHLVPAALGIKLQEKTVFWSVVMGPCAPDGAVAQIMAVEPDARRTCR